MTTLSNTTPWIANRHDGGTLTGEPIEKGSAPAGRQNTKGGRRSTTPLNDGEEPPPPRDDDRQQAGVEWAPEPPRIRIRGRLDNWKQSDGDRLVKQSDEGQAAALGVGAGGHPRSASCSRRNGW